uniref:Secreted protein n=1 Tax=Panagrellus redivivus TaxID=6233 RepID=A0A7E4VKA9_PANRE
MHSALHVLLCVTVAANVVAEDIVVTAKPLTTILIRPVKNYVVASPETIVVTRPPIRCPENNNWHMSYLYLNQPRCLAIHNIPSSTKDPSELRAICQKLYPTARPASFHSVEELRYANSIGFDGGVIGMYRPAGKALKPENFVNMDHAPVDFYPFTITSPTANAFQLVGATLHAVDFKNYIRRGNANVICALWV